MLLLTGPYQSGKTYQLWKQLRAEPLGSAVLVTPLGELTQQFKKQVYGWFGPGFLPITLGIAQFFERCESGGEKVPEELTQARAAHWFQDWAAKGLAGTCWESIAHYRGTARDLADLCFRLDQACVSDQDLHLASRQKDDRYLAEQCRALMRAREHLRERTAQEHCATPGQRLQLLAASGPAAPWRTIYFDDVMSMTPAQLAVLRALESGRQLVMNAVDDHRLGSGALVERLRKAFVHAEERRCDPAKAPPTGDCGAIVSLALTDEMIAVPADSVINYHYRDEAHAGRAIAALLRRRAIAPGSAVLFVRECNARGLALADALIAAGVPVRGSFQTPYAATAEGALIGALGAWCAQPTWRHFLSTCQRLIANDRDVGIERRAPLFLPELLGPWASRPATEALAKLKQSDRGIVDGWGWERESRAALSDVATWLEAWLKVLSVDGNWFARLDQLVRTLAPTEQAAGVLHRLAALDGDHAVGRTNLDEALALENVRVERGVDGDGALLIQDAVRGRAATREVAIIHDLELGLWPYQPGQGGLFARDARRKLAAALGDKDPYDEEARKSGEIASFLAVLARGSKQVVLGIGCGERQPSPWLTTVAQQLGWNLENERAKESAEIMPGAPLGPADSQGPAEQALWQKVGQPSFAFMVPAGKASDLALRASQLNDLLCDSFAVVCDRMRCRAPFTDRARQDLGIQFHKILAGITANQKTLSPVACEQALARWIDAAGDQVERALRRHAARGVVAAIEKEAALFAGAPAYEMAAEREIAISLKTATGALSIKGIADRIDRFADGSARIVDYKIGAIQGYRDLLNAEQEGQLLAYAIGLRQEGLLVVGAHYRGLVDGNVAGYRDQGAWYAFGNAHNSYPGIGVDEFAEREARLVTAIDTLAAGSASTGVDGLCADRGFAPIARLDEARLDLQAGEGAGEAAE